MDSNSNSTRDDAVGVTSFDVSQLIEKVSLPIKLYHDLPFFSDLLECKSCSCRSEAHRVVPGIGPVAAEFMFLGRNPGRDEDALGQPFIGKGGGILDVWLEILGLDRLKVLITNLVKCHTKKDRPPKAMEIEVCTDLWLRREITHLPHLKVIFALGNQAVQFILGPDAASTGQLVAYFVNVKFGERFLTVIPLAHPGYLLRARQHLSRMHDQVLPKIREYLLKEQPEAYARAARRINS